MLPNFQFTFLVIFVEAKYYKSNSTKSFVVTNLLKIRKFTLKPNGTICYQSSHIYQWSPVHIGTKVLGTYSIILKSLTTTDKNKGENLWNLKFFQQKLARLTNG